MRKDFEDCSKKLWIPWCPLIKLMTRKNAATAPTKNSVEGRRDGGYKWVINSLLFLVISVGGGRGILPSFP